MKNVFHGLIFGVIILLFIVTTVLLSTIFAFLLKNWGKENPTKEGNVRNEYQIMRFDLETKKTTIGFTTIERELKPNEFLTFDDEYNGLNLISHLDSTEYICSGVCYCGAQESTERRKISSLNPSISKPLTFLLASISSVSVLHIAKNHFQEKCEEELRDVCDSSNKVLSEIDECKAGEIMDKYDDYLDDEGVRAQADNVRGVYACKGKCFSSKHAEYFTYDRLSEYVKTAFSKDLKSCEDLEISQVWNIQHTNVSPSLLDEMNSEYMGAFGVELSPSRFATRVWEDQKLDPFCSEHSQGMCVGVDEMIGAENVIRRVSRSNKCKKVF